jgi:hypothetical protein
MNDSIITSIRRSPSKLRYKAMSLGCRTSDSAIAAFALQSLV